MKLEGNKFNRRFIVKALGSLPFLKSDLSLAQQETFTASEFASLAFTEQGKLLSLVESCPVKPQNVTDRMRDSDKQSLLIVEQLLPLLEENSRIMGYIRRNQRPLKFFEGAKVDHLLDQEEFENDYIALEYCSQRGEGLSIEVNDPKKRCVEALEAAKSTLASIKKINEQLLASHDKTTAQYFNTLKRYVDLVSDIEIKFNCSS